MQFHDRISYVFLGSKTHLIGQIFSQQDRAFYGFGKLMRIDKIPSDEMQKYIVNRIEQSGGSCDPVFAREMISIAGNIPYFVQFLASETWNASLDNGGMAGHDQILQATENILNNQQDYFHQLFDQLSPYQKKVLQALSSERTMIFSQDYMKKYDLGAVAAPKEQLKNC